jgi:guanylate cyclase, putative
VPADAAYLYDAVYIYAQALNECLADGNDSRNGKAIFEYMKSHPYQSMHKTKTNFEIISELK